MSRYKELGVDVKKAGIQKFGDSINNIFPEAFCVIQQDPVYEDMGMVLHTDSAGSKPVQAYLHYRETGNPKWFRGLAQDALAMNLNDILCVGAQPVSFVDYIAFNTLLINRIDLLTELSMGFEQCISLMKEQGLNIMFAGGETADLPDLLRTLDVCVAMFGRAKLNDFVTGDKVEPGDVIIGLRSGGEVIYEPKKNSGIMSNGLTLARSSLMKKEYLEKYPEISHPDKGRYTGKYCFDDDVAGLEMTIGEALLFPTRLFAPIAKAVIDEYRYGIHGMVHNTGGGQTKCLRVGKNIRYIKNHLPEPDKIFSIIKKESGVSWKEMYQDFNMGIGFEFIVKPSIADEIISICERFKIGVRKIGYCKKSNNANSLQIKSEFGTFEYS
ncbi:phosphoribosylformylglycinamidine cyclo-ligase [Candidatus Bathyarchaeota archaeon]|nr:phosphoribosylformylglycinamidine cyclo-ligase [Candidatus Bathyarchaeota archaeon]